MDFIKWSVLAVLIVMNQARAASIEDLSRGLVSARAEVEALDLEVTKLRQENELKLDPIRQRALEIESSVLKARSRIEQLHAKERFLREKLSVMARKSTSGDEIDRWVGELRGYIARVLPFQLANRIEDLRVVEDRHRQGDLLEFETLNELWRLTERELSLARSNEYGIDKIPLQDTPTEQGEYARIGMMALVYRTPSGKLGFLKSQTDGVWRSEQSNSERLKRSIDRIINRFKKHDRTGWFEIPGMALRMSQVSDDSFVPDKESQ